MAFIVVDFHAGLYNLDVGSRLLASKLLRVREVVIGVCYRGKKSTRQSTVEDHVRDLLSCGGD